MQIFIKYDREELDGRIKNLVRKAKAPNTGMDWRKDYDKEKHRLKIKRYRDKKRALGYVKSI